MQPSFGPLSTTEVRALSLTLSLAMFAHTAHSAHLFPPRTAEIHFLRLFTLFTSSLTHFAHSLVKLMIFSSIYSWNVEAIDRSILMGVIDTFIFTTKGKWHENLP